MNLAYGKICNGKTIEGGGGDEFGDFGRKSSLNQTCVYCVCVLYISLIYRKGEGGYISYITTEIQLAMTEIIQLHNQLVCIYYIYILEV